ncbi:unnamed protein product [Danaus chrysippus]|uniref:Inositol-pentakisphosphate 2-kinase n=1 Tax=Danaus chrysippus TaxID=151541 RepID=A0A8J2VVT3_9NEOP|nr:unnamed protein product [Danaus chrysippus]
MSSLGKNWKYINEGNVHIVLHILNSDCVIRLIKEDDRSHTDYSVVRNSVNFVNRVMIPLLFENYNYQEEVITINPDEIATLSNTLKLLRPKHRQIKNIISQYAIRAPNLALIDYEFDNYCVEIKPKEGFMSKKFIKYAKCYFCLKQYIKLNENQISKISNYCPLDLFSGNKIRIKKALKSLIENPQNNFKLFKNGMVIYNEQSNVQVFEHLIAQMPFLENVNNFLDLIIEILLSEGNSDIILHKSTYDMISESTLGCVEERNPYTNSLLNKLLGVQKLSKNFDNCYPEPSDSYEYVSFILNMLNDEHLDLSNTTDRESFLSHIDSSHLALISAVAKDCSIMITFTNKSHENLPTIRIGDETIAYKMSITDLEPKIQPNSETRSKQLQAWQELISEYMKATKQSTIDVRESQNSPLFNNTAIDRRLSPEGVLTVLEDMAKSGKAAPIDKSKNVWEVYWHSLDEWGNMIYNWASSNGLNNTVCTLYELREGDNTVGEEFHGLDMNILIKALKALSSNGKCELIEFDDNQGVKFF